MREFGATDGVLVMAMRCQMALVVGLLKLAACSSPSASTDGALDLGADQAAVDARSDTLGVDALADIDESSCVTRREPVPPVPRDAPIVARRGLAWRSAVGVQYGHTFSPALLGDRIILPINQTGVVAVDLQGKLLWTEQVFGETAWQFDTEVYPHANGTVAYTTPNGALIMLDRQGQRLWTQTGLGPFVDFGLPNILSALRLDDGSTVVLTTGHRLIRVSTAGAILWSRALPVDEAAGTWRLLRVRGPRERLIVAGSDVLAYDTEGTLLWHRSAPSDAPSTSRVAVGLAGLSSGDVVIYWSFRVAGADWTRHLYLLEPSCGRLRELVTLPPGAFPLLLIDDKDHIFVLSHWTTDRLTRYRPAGSISWELSLPHPHIFRSMVLGSDGALFLVDYVDAAPTSTRVLRVDVETGAWTVVFAQSDVRFTGHPLIIDGLLVSGAFDPHDPGAKSMIVGIRVSSPRLMQRGWPRFGGGNDNAFTLE